MSIKCFPSFRECDMRQCLYWAGSCTMQWPGLQTYKTLYHPASQSADMMCNNYNNSSLNRRSCWSWLGQASPQKVVFQIIGQSNPKAPLTLSWLRQASPQKVVFQIIGQSTSKVPLMLLSWPRQTSPQKVIFQITSQSNPKAPLTLSWLRQASLQKVVFQIIG